MSLGTIRWIPQDSGRRGMALVLTSARLRMLILFISLFFTGLAVLFFEMGKAGSSMADKRRDSEETELVKAELYQLSRRVDGFESRLKDVAVREKQILVAGSGLNIDLSKLVPQDDGEPEFPGDDMFRYIDDIELKLLLMERLAEAELMVYDSLATFFVEQKERLARIPSIWPVDGIFVSSFGPRVDPFTGAVRMHKGIDLACARGTPIYAPADGEVAFVGWTGGWGLSVVIRHTDRISTRYAHCSAICTVVGNEVKRGDLIARVGSTGRSVAPHLHYEVLIDGVQVDPENYIIREGSDSAVF